MESLDQLNSHTAEEFETWLGKQLRLVYGGTPEEKYRACDFRHLGIPRGESHIDALQGLFKKLSIDAREQFKKALERILRHARPDDFPGEALADIVTLTGLTEAYGAFPAFVSVLGSGPWGEILPSLIYDALSVLMMFDRSDEAYETAKGLATSTNFPNSLVFDAYLVMARSRPENWRDDLALLRDRFNKIYQDVINSADAGMLEQLHRRHHSLTQSLSETIPLSELGLQLATLKFAPTTSPETASDDWLIDNLFQPSGPIGLMENDDTGEIVIIDRTNPARMAKVNTTPQFEVGCILRRLIDPPARHYSATYDNLQLSIKSSVILRNALGTRKQNFVGQPTNQKVAHAY